MVPDSQLRNDLSKLRVMSNSTLFSLIEAGRIVSPFATELIACNGLDLRLADECVRLRSTKKVFDTHKKNPLKQFFQVERKPHTLIRPQEKVLVCTIEQVRMPNNMAGLVGLRSTYSRLGLQMPLGFVDPGFVGQLTLELSGGTFPILLHEGDRVFHVMFVELNRTSDRTYHGKYQNQRGVRLPSFRR